jgi:GH15 family glucan-1,4-alpha-glucosidase
LWEGLVLRYRTHAAESPDGLPSGEGVFLPCSFWLCDCYELLGRHDDAHALFERLIGLSNDLGLLAEEYDPVERRQLGNFPQAFTHLALVSTAFNVLPHLPSPMHRRHARDGSQPPH